MLSKTVPFSEVLSLGIGYKIENKLLDGKEKDGEDQLDR
jgi:hypothetical protein